MDKNQSDKYFETTRGESLHFPSESDPQICGYCGQRFDDPAHIREVIRYPGISRKETLPPPPTPSYLGGNSDEKQWGEIFFAAFMILVILVLGVYIFLMAHNRSISDDSVGIFVGTVLRKISVLVGSSLSAGNTL